MTKNLKFESSPVKEAISQFPEIVPYIKSYTTHKVVFQNGITVLFLRFSKYTSSTKSRRLYDNDIDYLVGLFNNSTFLGIKYNRDIVISRESRKTFFIKQADFLEQPECLQEILARVCNKPIDFLKNNETAGIIAKLKKKKGRVKNTTLDINKNKIQIMLEIGMDKSFIARGFQVSNSTLSNWVKKNLN